ncbi:hypothetical protein BH11PLA2_BH11PLA2_10150 [soil metagenome]
MILANGLGIAAAGMAMLIVVLFALAGPVLAMLGVYLLIVKKGRRGVAVALIAGGVFLPVFCCGLPHLMFRLEHGRGPIDGALTHKIKNNMTSQEVVAILGPPHSIDRDTWFYWDGAIAGTWFMVRFSGDIVIDTAIE